MKRIGNFFVLCAAFVLCAPLAAENFRQIQKFSANGVNAAILLYQNSDNTIIEFRAINHDAITYGVKVSVDLENMRADTSLPFIGTLAGNSRTETTLFRIIRIDPTKAYYYRNLNWHLQAGIPIANPTAPVIHDGVYECPWGKGKSFTVANGYNGYGAHVGIWAYATDFSMPVGTPIHAARAGTVSAVQQSFSKGGNDPSLGDKANYIYILHKDGSTARYLHIQKNGARVRVGQQVRVGDVIALSGNVGWSTGPHLHFDVVVPDVKEGMRTIPIEFIQGNKRVTPTKGLRLSR